MRRHVYGCGAPRFIRGNWVVQGASACGIVAHLRNRVGHGGSGQCHGQYKKLRSAHIDCFFCEEGDDVMSMYMKIYSAEDV